MVNPYLITGLMSAAPISEARGAIIYGSAVGLNIYYVFILSVLINILIIPILFWVLKQARFRKLADKVFGQNMQKKIEKNKDKLDKYGIFALLFFVAIPFPVTGAWTGTFIAEILKMNRKKAFLVISLGVIIAATLVSLGIGSIITLI